MLTELRFNLHPGSFIQVNKFTDQPTQRIQQLLQIWSNAQSDADEASLQVISGFTDKSADQDYFNDINNLLELESIFFFALARVKSLTQQLRDIMTQVDGRGEVSLSNEEFQAHMKIESCIQQYVQILTLAYTTHNFESNTYLTFQKHCIYDELYQESRLDYPLSEVGGVFDTILLTFENKTTALIFIFLQECGFLSNLSDSVARKEYCFNEHIGLKVKMIISSYKDFIFDNQALDLNRNILNLFRDQTYFEEIQNFQKNQETFIQQSYFKEIPRKKSFLPFTDDLNLQISDKLNTKIDNITVKYQQNYHPLLLARHIFKLERNIEIPLEDITLVYDHYFYILAENLKPLRSIRVIEDRKWLLISHRVAEQKEHNYTNENGLFSTVQQKDQFTKHQPQLLLINQNLGRLFEKHLILINLRNNNRFIQWIDIEQTLLSRHKLTCFSQAGLQTYYVKPYQKLIDILMSHLHQSIVETPDKETTEPYLKYKDNQYVDVKKAISLTIKSFEDDNSTFLFQKTLLNFFSNLFRSLYHYLENKDMINQQLRQQIVKIGQDFIFYIQFLIISVVYQKQEGRNNVYLYSLISLFITDSNEINFQEKFFESCRPYWRLLLLSILISPDKNPIEYLELSYSRRAGDLKTGEQIVHVQTCLDECFPVDPKKAQIIIPYFYKGRERELAGIINTDQIGALMYQIYEEHLSNGRNTQAFYQIKALISFYTNLNDFQAKNDKVLLLKLFIAIKGYLSEENHERQSDTLINNVFNDAVSLKSSDITDEIKGKVDIEKFNESIIPYLELLLTQDITKSDVGKNTFSIIAEKFQTDSENFFEKLLQFLRSQEQHEVREYKTYKNSKNQFAQTYLQIISQINVARSQCIQNYCSYVFNRVLQAPNSYQFVAAQRIVKKIHQMGHYLKQAPNQNNYIGFEYEGSFKLDDTTVPNQFIIWANLAETEPLKDVLPDLEASLMTYIPASNIHKEGKTVMRIHNWVQLYHSLDNFEETINQLHTRNYYITLMNCTRKNYKDSNSNEWKLFKSASFEKYFSPTHMRAIARSYTELMRGAITNLLQFILNEQKNHRFFLTNGYDGRRIINTMYELNTKYSSKQLSKYFRNFFYDFSRSLQGKQEQPIVEHLHKLFREELIPELIIHQESVASRLEIVGKEITEAQTLSFKNSKDIAALQLEFLQSVNNLIEVLKLIGKKNENSSEIQKLQEAVAGKSYQSVDFYSMISSHIRIIKTLESVNRVVPLCSVQGLSPRAKEHPYLTYVIQDYKSDVEILKIITTYFNQEIFHESFQDLYGRRDIITYFMLDAKDQQKQLIAEWLNIKNLHPISEFQQLYGGQNSYNQTNYLGELYISKKYKNSVLIKQAKAIQSKIQELQKGQQATQQSNQIQQEKVQVEVVAQDQPAQESQAQANQIVQTQQTDQQSTPDQSEEQPPAEEVKNDEKKSEKSKYTLKQLQDKLDENKMYTMARITRKQVIPILNDIIDKLAALNFEGQFYSSIPRENSPKQAYNLFESTLTRVYKKKSLSEEQGKDIQSKIPMLDQILLKALVFYSKEDIEFVQQFDNFCFIRALKDAQKKDPIVFASNMMNLKSQYKLEKQEEQQIVANILKDNWKALRSADFLQYQRLLVSMKYFTTALADSTYGIEEFFDDHFWNVENSLNQLENNLTNEHAFYEKIIDYIGFSLSCVESISRLSTENSETRLNQIDSLIKRLGHFKWPLKFSDLAREPNRFSMPQLTQYFQGLQQTLFAHRVSPQYNISNLKVTLKYIIIPQTTSELKEAQGNSHPISKNIAREIIEQTFKQVDAQQQCSKRFNLLVKQSLRQLITKQVTEEEVEVEEVRVKEVQKSEKPEEQTEVSKTEKEEELTENKEESAQQQEIQPQEDIQIKQEQVEESKEQPQSLETQEPQNQKDQTEQTEKEVENPSGEKSQEEVKEQEVENKQDEPQPEEQAKQATENKPKEPETETVKVKKMMKKKQYFINIDWLDNLTQETPSYLTDLIKFWIQRYMESLGESIQQFRVIGKTKYSIANLAGQDLSKEKLTYSIIHRNQILSLLYNIALTFPLELDTIFDQVIPQDDDVYQLTRDAGLKYDQITFLDQLTFTDRVALDSNSSFCKALHNNLQSTGDNEHSILYFGFRNKILSRINFCLRQIADNLDLNNNSQLMIVEALIKNGRSIEKFVDPQLALETVQIYERIFRATVASPILQYRLSNLEAFDHVSHAYDLYVKSLIMNELNTRSPIHLSYVNQENLFFYVRKNLKDILQGDLANKFQQTQIDLSKQTVQINQKSEKAYEPEVIGPASDLLNQLFEDSYRAQEGQIKKFENRNSFAFFSQIQSKNFKSSADPGVAGHNGCSSTLIQQTMRLVHQDKHSASVFPYINSQKQTQSDKVYQPKLHKVILRSEEEHQQKRDTLLKKKEEEEQKKKDEEQKKIQEAEKKKIEEEEEKLKEQEKVQQQGEVEQPDEPKAEEKPIKENDLTQEERDQILDEIFGQSNAAHESRDEDSNFDFDYYGYPNNALTLYDVNRREFNELDTDGKKSLLALAQSAFEAKQRLLKYQKFMNKYESNLVTKYFASLKGQEQTMDDEDIKQFLSSQEFSDWFQNLSDKLKKLLITATDPNYIKYFSEDIQKQMKEQWKQQTTVKFNDGAGAKIEVADIYQTLKDKRDEELAKIKEEKEKEDAVNEEKRKVEEERQKQIQEKADHQKQLEQHVEELLQLQREENQDHSEAILNLYEEIQRYQAEQSVLNAEMDSQTKQETQEATLDSELKTQVEEEKPQKIDLRVTEYDSTLTIGLKNLLNNPEFFAKLYPFDLKVFCDYEFSRPGQILFLSPKNFLGSFLELYIGMVEESHQLRKTLRGYRQFENIPFDSTIEVVNSKHNLIFNESTEEMEEDPLNLIANVLQVKISWMERVQGQLQNFSYVRLNDVNFWGILQQTGQVSFTYFDQETLSVQLKQIVDERHYQLFQKYLQAYKHDCQKLTFIDILQNQLKSLGDLWKKYMEYNRQTLDWDTDDHQPYIRDSKRNNLAEMIQKLLRRFADACEEDSSEVPFKESVNQSFKIRDKTLQLFLAQTLQTKYFTEQIKQTNFATLLENTTKDDFEQFAEIGTNIFTENMKLLQALIIPLTENIQQFQSRLQLEHGAQNLNDRNLFQGDQYDEWISAYDRVLGKYSSQIDELAYIKSNLRYLMREIRCRSIKEFKEKDYKQFVKIQDQEKDKEEIKAWILSQVELKMENYSKILYRHLTAKQNGIMTILKQLIELADAMEKTQTTKDKDPIYEYRRWVELFKLPFLINLIDQRANGTLAQATEQQDKQEQNAPQEEKQEEVNKDEDEVIVAALPPPKLSRLFTREETAEPTESNPLEPQFTRSFSVLKKAQREVSLKELLDTFMQNLSGFFLIFVQERSSRSKLWSRVLKGSNIQADIETRIKMINTQIKNSLNGDDIDDKYDEITIQVDRDHVWHSTLTIMLKRSLYALISNDFNIKFAGERGIDAGGLSAEWITLVIKEIMDPRLGLFQVSANGATLQPNPLSYIIPHHLVHFRYLGRLIAAALLKNLPVAVDLTKSVLKHLTKQHLFILDLQDIDPELTKNLLQLLEIDVEPLYLTYSHYEQVFGEIIQIDLGKPSDEPITNENKKEYVKAVANYKMTVQIKDQIEALVGGFEEIIPRKYLKGIDAKEIGLKLSGLKYIDADDWRENCEFHGYTKESEQMVWLFELLKNDFTEQQKANFLFYITGSFKVHFNGFKEMRIKIERTGDPLSLPISHTCFKTIEMPPYASKEIMKSKILMACEEGSKGFYIA